MIPLQEPKSIESFMLVSEFLQGDDNCLVALSLANKELNQALQNRYKKGEKNFFFHDSIDLFSKRSLGKDIVKYICDFLSDGQLPYSPNLDIINLSKTCTTLWKKSLGSQDRDCYIYNICKQFKSREENLGKIAFNYIWQFHEYGRNLPISYFSFIGTYIQYQDGEKQIAAALINLCGYKCIFDPLLASRISLQEKVPAYRAELKLVTKYSESDEFKEREENDKYFNADHYI